MHYMGITPKTIHIRMKYEHVSLLKLRLKLTKQALMTCKASTISLWLKQV